MNHDLTQIQAQRLLPIVVIDNTEHAATLGEVLAGGELPLVEVTFRTPAAESAVRIFAKRGDLLVGAGTILATEQADHAIHAGAEVLGAPGTDSKLVEHVV